MNNTCSTSLGFRTVVSKAMNTNIDFKTVFDCGDPNIQTMLQCNSMDFDSVLASSRDDALQLNLKIELDAE